MNILVVAALKEELAGHFDDVPVLYTGVGKVNATYALTRELAKRGSDDPAYLDGPEGWYLPDLVLNFGTAGSRFVKAGRLVECTRFSQHDMNCTELGYPRGDTPFDNNDIKVFQGCPKKLGLSFADCYTSDTFYAKEHLAPWKDAVVDMEAYALAKVCARENVPFACVKYISDGGKAEDWKINVGKGAAKFREIYDRLVDQ